jgi:uncharacterized RDD family membrane protein YckC
MVNDDDDLELDLRADVGGVRWEPTAEERAPMGHRLVAYFVDMGLVVLASLAGALVMPLLAGADIPLVLKLKDLPGFFIYAIQMLVFIAWPGCTIGKLLLGIRVVGDDQGYPGVWMGFVFRGWGRGILAPIWALMAYFRPNVRLPYETYTGTWVVRGRPN